MNLDANYLRKLNYTEVNLKDIEIEITPTDDSQDALDDERDCGCGIGIKGDKPLTEEALKQLCSYLRIPYPFTKQLRENGRAHVLAYVQRQLSQASNASAILVAGNKSIVSVTDEEKLHYRGQEAISFDTRLREIVGAVNSPFELAGMVCDRGDINYSILYKEPEVIEADDTEEGAKELKSLWRWGFTVKHSALGTTLPSIGVELLRMVCANLTYLPAKTHNYPMPFEFEFEERWEHVANFLVSPPPAQWLTLNGMVTKLSRTTASFREVAEARKKLLKLKIDKEDTETAERINNVLQWKRIRKAYGISEMEEKPTKSWYSKAGTPLNLFELYNTVTREATHAPSTLDATLRQNILIYAGGILAGKPDLFQVPQAVDWSLN